MASKFINDYKYYSVVYFRLFLARGADSEARNNENDAPISVSSHFTDLTGHR